MTTSTSIDPLIEAICKRLHCGADSIMSVLDMYERDLMLASCKSRRAAQTQDEKIDEILASVRAIESRGGPLEADMCATIRQITETFDESKGVPFLDDAVRSLAKAMVEHKEQADMLRGRVADLEVTVGILSRHQRLTEREIDAKHWQ